MPPFMKANLMNYFYQVINGKKKSAITPLLLTALYILTGPYYLVVTIRRCLYCLRLLPRRRLPVPVVSVGNITMGGTGKTPFVRYLVLYYKSRGYRPAVLLQGSGGEFNDDVGVVGDGASLCMDAAAAGEEAVMMVQQVPGVPVLIGQNRYLAGMHAVENLGADIIILDDGFQCRGLRRNLDVVVIDGSNPFGRGFLRPRGFLREPPWVLRWAQVIVITKAEQVPPRRLENLRDKLKELAPKAVQAEAAQKPVFLKEGGGDIFLPLDLSKKRVLAFSAIGDPRSFEETIRSLGGEITARAHFPDYHHYTEEELLQIFALAFSRKVDLIITTERDFVGLPQRLRQLIIGQKMALWMLGIEVIISSNEELLHEKLEEIVAIGGKKNG